MPRALLALGLTCLVAPPLHAASYTFVVSGLGGEPQYEQRFREQAAAVADAARSAGGSDVSVLSGEKADRESLRKELRALAGKAAAEDRVTVVLIGHGSFDGEEYRLNLPGPDITGSELGNLFDQLRAREQLIVNATSSSGAAAERWKRNGRVVITATKSGGERTATRFGEFWKQAIASAEADVNKDEVVSAAEAYEFASRKVADAFKADASLATEHARIEGTGAERFVVARFGAAAVASTDPAVNALYAQRTNLENELNAVKGRKQDLSADAYYDELEAVLVRLAMLQREIDAKQPAGRGGRGE
jgi:hypothetical protein